MSHDISLLDSRTDRYVDALYAVLITSDEFQFFPEMYEIFGRETVVRFLDVFAGQVIKVPSREMLERNVRDVTIWIEMKKGKRKNTHLMDEFEVSEVELDRIYHKIEEALKRLGIGVV